MVPPPRMLSPPLLPYIARGVSSPLPTCALLTPQPLVSRGRYATPMTPHHFMYGSCTNDDWVDYSLFLTEAERHYNYLVEVRLDHGSHPTRTRHTARVHSLVTCALRPLCVRSRWRTSTRSTAGGATPRRCVSCYLTTRSRQTANPSIEPTVPSTVCTRWRSTCTTSTLARPSSPSTAADSRACADSAPSSTRSSSPSCLATCTHLSPPPPPSSSHVHALLTPRASDTRQVPRRGVPRRLGVPYF